MDITEIEKIMIKNKLVFRSVLAFQDLRRMRRFDTTGGVFLRRSKMTRSAEKAGIVKRGGRIEVDGKEGYMVDMKMKLKIYCVSQSIDIKIC